MSNVQNIAGMVFLYKQIEELRGELNETKKALNETRDQVQALLDMKKMGQIEADPQGYINTLNKN
jgi:uncharacterized coiled-coil protein SlyX